jgi:hypothetical protein
MHLQTSILHSFNRQHEFFHPSQRLTRLHKSGKHCWVTADARLFAALLAASELDGVFLIVVVDNSVDVRRVLKVYRMPTRCPLRDCYCVCGT